jgi:hypothetical protein
MEEIVVPGENHRHVASHWQTLLHSVVSSTPRHEHDSNSQCEVYLVRIMKQVGEKRSTVDTHMDAYCLLKNTSTKHNNSPVTKCGKESGTMFPSRSDSRVTASQYGRLGLSDRLGRRPTPTTLSISFHILFCMSTLCIGKLCGQDKILSFCLGEY